VLLQKGGPLVIRRLCAAMGPEVVFKEFASILDAELDLSFASTMVQVGLGRLAQPLWASWDHLGLSADRG
jgi:hypothetical protein